MYAPLLCISFIKSIIESVHTPLHGGYSSSDIVMSKTCDEIMVDGSYLGGCERFIYI